MNILITGVPGTGKTTISIRLSKRLGYPVIHINDIVNEYHLFTRYDQKTRSKIVKMKELEDYLTNLLSDGNHIVEGHLGCDLDLPVDVVIVLRTHPRILYSRLKRRGYPTHKIEENVWAELLDYCVINSEERYDVVYEVNTTNKSVDHVVGEIIDLINRKRKPKHYDWSKYLESGINWRSPKRKDFFHSTK